ncbi:MAG: GDP-mannose 4,6-dehydratase [Ilumatobacter sp.]|nr:GDP-mannose 4,6-dehydratase [Ilumatobacter sp.]
MSVQLNPDDDTPGIGQVALVTGAAGFIGSTLTDHLLSEGWTVRGVDAFTPYYDATAKQSNLTGALGSDRFELVVADLLTTDLDELLADVQIVFHLAGQPGVRLSWADGFGTYVDLNINATQRLLEAARGRNLRRFVYASSSSVYGNALVVPTDEEQQTRPHSPYGVTKLAGELLCSAYGANFGVPTASVRYFTVYGPRQRPDMALHRMIEATLDGRPFPLFGDGSQVRDFTFVHDIVRATVGASTAEIPPATVVNAAGGSAVTMARLIEMVGEAVGAPVRVDHQPVQAGDVRATGGSVERARELLGWVPKVSLEQGIARQVEWHRSRRA